MLDSSCAKKPGPRWKSIMTSALLKHESNLGVAFQRWNQSRAQKGFKTEELVYHSQTLHVMWCWITLRWCSLSVLNLANHLRFESREEGAGGDFPLKL